MININNPIPLHVQIKDLLKMEIIQKKYDEKIPSERELMDRFSVSRTTIREAVMHLVNDGILEKVHGKGTFISQRTSIQDSLNSLQSLTETITSMGMKPGSMLLFNEIANEPVEIAEILQENEFYLITRIRTANTIPIAVERHYYTKEIGYKLAAYDLENATIYDLLENELAIDLYEAEQIISCNAISTYDADKLNIPEGTNILSVERTISNTLGEIVEYYTSIFKPDMYSFRIQTKRRK